jgi:hypothetical protein
MAYILVLQRAIFDKLANHFPRCDVMNATNKLNFTLFKRFF